MTAGRGADRTEVLVVGAGPAGSSLALRLAGVGVSVTLLDARAFPRSKPCGDAISPGATPLLEELGAREAVEAAGAARLAGWRLRAPDGPWFSGRFRAPSSSPARGLALPRATLDALLLEAAVAAGARFLPGRRVFDLLRRGGGPGSHGTSGDGAAGRIVGVVARGPDGREEAYRARLVAGADGLRSRVARRMGGVRRGRRDRLGLVARFAGPSLGTRFAGFGEMRVSADGVVGAAPTGADGCTLAMVVPRGRAPEISGDPDRFFRERLAGHDPSGRLRERLAGARRTGPLEVTGPFEVFPRRVVAPGALLVGDAAGYFDPFTGQGIGRALRLARAAARAAREALERPEREPEALGAYARHARRLLRNSGRVQRLIDAVASRRRPMNVAAALLARHPALADLLVDVTGDRLPPAALGDPRRLAAAALANPALRRRRAHA